MLNARNLCVGSKCEQGAVLIVALIMILIMTIIGLASVRGSGIQEKMAGNVRDYNVAFQAAESALREAELAIVNNTANIAEIEGSTDLDFWSDEDKWDDDRVTPVAIKLAEASERAKYVIEEFEVSKIPGLDGNSYDDKGPITFYRITSRGVGVSPNASVILQTIFVL